jgi:hypothetical protein
MKRIILSVVVLVVIGSVLAWVAKANTARHATLISDKPDYHPGETVKLTGAGWQPSERVTIVMSVDPITHGAITLNAVADDAGKLTNSLYVVQRSDLNVTFTVTARGDKDSTAQATFTDHYNTTDLHFGVSPVATGNSVGVVDTPSGGFTPASCTAASCAQTSSTTGGDVLQFTATAGSGYVFSSWTATYGGTAPSPNTCTNGSTTNPCSLTVPNNSGNTATVTATFVSNNKRKGQTIVGQLESIKGEVAQRGI